MARRSPENTEDPAERGLAVAATRSAPKPVEVTHGSVIRLALPMTLAHMSTPLLGFADATVIGRLGQPHLLGAIAACAVIFDFVFWGLGFLRLGTAGLTAQAVGSGEVAEERATVVRALILALALGLAVIALQAPIAWIAFAALDASPAVTEAARAYFDIRIWSAPFALVNYVVLGAVIGHGRTDIGLLLAGADQPDQHRVQRGLGGRGRAGGARIGPGYARRRISGRSRRARRAGPDARARPACAMAPVARSEPNSSAWSASIATS